MSVEPRHRTLLQRLQLLAGLKAYGLAGRNGDLGASAWIAANPGFARPHVENAEASQLDALSVRKSSLHAFENCFDGHFGLRLRNARLVYHFVDDVELDQGVPSRPKTNANLMIGLGLDTGQDQPAPKPFAKPARNSPLEPPWPLFFRPTARRMP